MIKSVQKKAIPKVIKIINTPPSLKLSNTKATGNTQRFVVHM